VECNPHCQWEITIPVRGSIHRAARPEGPKAGWGFRNGQLAAGAELWGRANSFLIISVVRMVSLATFLGLTKVLKLKLT